jgi:hypothetical protein
MSRIIISVCNHSSFEVKSRGRRSEGRPGSSFVYVLAEVVRTKGNSEACTIRCFATLDGCYIFLFTKQRSHRKEQRRWIQNETNTLTLQVAPAHEGVELGIGDALLMKGLAIATGRSEAQLKQQYNEEGDIGIVARKNKGKQATLIKPVPLTIQVRATRARECCMLCVWCRKHKGANTGRRHTMPHMTWNSCGAYQSHKM